MKPNQNHLEEAFNLYLEAYNGLARWSEEERNDWLAQCEREGFSLEAAARLYDKERERVRSELSFEEN